MAIMLATSPAVAGGCPAASPEAARVAAVLDDLDLALDDGRELRLAGIDPARATPGHPGLGDETRRAVSAWLSGREVTLVPLATEPDRWARVPALVWAEAAPARLAAPLSPASTSVAETVLAMGWGRARPEPLLPACFSGLRAWEGQARTSGLGLWGDPYYAILDADDAPGLASHAGAMALVEGRLSLGAGRARSFLRLGRKAGAFAATLSRRSSRILAKAGLDPGTLAGKRVRIRGFLDDRFGPQIDVTSLDQIEVLDEAGQTPATVEPTAAGASE